MSYHAVSSPKSMKLAANDKGRCNVISGHSSFSCCWEVRGSSKLCRGWVSPPPPNSGPLASLFVMTVKLIKSGADAILAVQGSTTNGGDPGGCNVDARGGIGRLSG